MSAIDNGGGGVIPGALVLVTTGRYWLHHARVESVLPDRGSHGFARLRFFGRSGYPLVRAGMRWDSDLPLPPEDIVPMTALSRWSTTSRWRR